MPRNMSFSLTAEQIRNRTKTVTRRLGWANLQPGTTLNACGALVSVGVWYWFVRMVFGDLE